MATVPGDAAPGPIANPDRAFNERLASASEALERAEAIASALHWTALSIHSGEGYNDGGPNTPISEFLAMLATLKDDIQHARAVAAGSRPQPAEK